jgi:hypothetical protein
MWCWKADHHAEKRGDGQRPGSSAMGRPTRSRVDRSGCWAILARRSHGLASEKTAGSLEQGWLLRASRPGWRRQSKVWLATARGLRSAEVALRPARVVGWRLSHDLALVDLSEQLLGEIRDSYWLTERELMVGGWRTSLKLRRLPDGLLVHSDGRRFAVELEASRKDAERLRRIVNHYLPALAGPNALAGVIWYARPQLSTAVEHLRSAVKSQGLSWAFEVRTWEARP